MAAWRGRPDAWRASRGVRRGCSELARADQRGGSRRLIRTEYLVAVNGAGRGGRRATGSCCVPALEIGGGHPSATPRTDVVLLGFGRVGRALADQIAAANGQAAVRVVGLLDRSGYVFEPRGLSRKRLLDLAREKDAGALLATLGGTRAAAPKRWTVMAGHAGRPGLVDGTTKRRRSCAARRPRVRASSRTRSRSPGRGQLRGLPRRRCIGAAVR